MKISDVPRWKTSALVRTVNRARLRALSNEELLEYLLTASPPEREAVIVAEEREWSAGQRRTLATAAVRLAEIGDTVPSGQKGTYDRRIKDMARLLDDTDAVQLAAAQLGHRRKARRDIAARILGRRSLPASLRDLISSRFEVSPLPQHVYVLARHADDLQPNLLTCLFHRTEDEFDRVLVVEAMIRAGLEAAPALADHPAEVIWAIGRAQRHDLLDVVHDAFARAPSNDRALSLYIWCLGRLQDSETILQIERELVNGHLT